MKKTGQHILKKFLEHTPPHTHAFVQNNYENSGIGNLNDQTKILPMLNYIESLNKHKEYLDFF